MNETNCGDGVGLRLSERADLFAPGMSRKVAQLLPYKTQIRKLRGRNASYDCIRLILAEESINVSLSTLYRFCQKRLRDKPDTGSKPRRPVKNGQTGGIQPTPLENSPQEQRQPVPGPWSRRKRGPRIANSKTL